MISYNEKVNLDQDLKTTTDISILEKFSNSNSLITKLIIIKNPATPIYVLEKMFYGDNTFIFLQKAIASSTSIPSKTLKEFYKYSQTLNRFSNLLSKAIMSNPNWKLSEFE